MEEKENQLSEEKKEGMADIGILDVYDLAVLLRVSPQTARRYINEGRIPGYRVVPGRWLISVDHLKRHIESHSNIVD